MSTLASDTFNRANANPIGGNWTTGSGDGAMQITSNAAWPADNTLDSQAYYNAVTWPADQWSEVAVTSGTIGGGTGFGVSARKSAAAATHYRLVVDRNASNNIELAKVVAGAFTLIWDRTSAYSDGDVIRLEVQGTTLRAYRNGTQIGADSTDSGIATGNAGIMYSSTDTAAKGDNWNGGDFSSGVTAAQEIPVFIAQQASQMIGRMYQ